MSQGVRLADVDYLPDPETGCWNWQLSLNNAGYGIKCVPTYRRVLGHRYYYEQLVGPIPEGHDLDHLCRNPRCCNPDHLEPVTRSENLRRGARGRVSLEAIAEIQAGGSPRALARKYGVSETTVYKWRNRRAA